MGFTELEKLVLDVLSKPNDNGEMIAVDRGDYLELFAFGIDNKTLRGVLSSLVKKQIIILKDWEFGTVVSFTNKGYEIVLSKSYDK